MIELYNLYQSIYARSSRCQVIQLLIYIMYVLVEHLIFSPDNQTQETRKDTRSPT